MTPPPLIHYIVRNIWQYRTSATLAIRMDYELLNILASDDAIPTWNSVSDLETFVNY